MLLPVASQSCWGASVGAGRVGARRFPGGVFEGCGGFRVWIALARSSVVSGCQLHDGRRRPYGPPKGADRMTPHAGSIALYRAPWKGRGVALDVPVEPWFCVAKCARCRTVSAPGDQNVAETMSPGEDWFPVAAPVAVLNRPGASGVGAEQAQLAPHTFEHRSNIRSVYSVSSLAQRLVRAWR